MKKLEYDNNKKKKKTSFNICWQVSIIRTQTSFNQFPNWKSILVKINIYIWYPIRTYQKGNHWFLFSIKGDCFLYIFIFHFKLHILLKNNYTKHNVSRLMTILSSQNSLNNTYIYIRQEAFNTWFYFYL